MVCPECGIYIVEGVPCRKCGYHETNAQKEQEVIVENKMKSSKTNWFMWLLLLILFGFLVIDSGNNIPEDRVGLGPVSGSAISKSDARDKIKFKILSVKKADNKAIVKGEVVNLDEGVHNFDFTVEFYSKEETLLTTETGTVSDLHPNETKAFETITTASPKEMKYYRAQVKSFVPLSN